MGRGGCGSGGSRSGAASGAPGEAARRVPTPTNGRRGLLTAPWAPCVLCRANGLMGPPVGVTRPSGPRAPRSSCCAHLLSGLMYLGLDFKEAFGIWGWGGGSHAESAIALPKSAEQRRTTPGSRVQWCRDSQPQDLISPVPTVCPCTMPRASSFPALPGHLGSIR